MRFFRKVNDYREPPGLERVVLRKIPVYLAGGTFVPLAMAILSRMLPIDGAVAEVAKRIQIIDYIALGAVFTVWTAALTVLIGCCVVMVMKGPHYAADSYYLDGTHRSEQGDTGEHSDH